MRLPFNFSKPSRETLIPALIVAAVILGVAIIFIGVLVYLPPGEIVTRR